MREALEVAAYLCSAASFALAAGLHELARELLDEAVAVLPLGLVLRYDQPNGGRSPPSEVE